MKKSHRSKKQMTYHGRTGKPIIHYTEEEKKYIMVGATGGGTKRLYLKDGNIPKKQRK